MTQAATIVFGVLALVALTMLVALPAGRCWRAGGEPVASIGRMVCVAPNAIIKT